MAGVSWGCGPLLGTSYHQSVTSDQTGTGSRSGSIPDAEAEVAEWQTRRTQNPVHASECGFKSHLRHSREIRTYGELCGEIGAWFEKGSGTGQAPLCVAPSGPFRQRCLTPFRTRPKSEGPEE